MLISHVNFWIIGGYPSNSCFFLFNSNINEKKKPSIIFIYIFYFRLVNPKQDITYPSFEDTSVNNMAIWTWRVKSSEAHKNSSNSQNHHSSPESTKLKNHKSCIKPSKKETSYANTSEKNVTCYSEPVTQFQIDNDLKLIFEEKSIKKSMKSALKSNSIKKSSKLKSVQKPKSLEKIMEMISALEIYRKSIEIKNSENKQKSKNTKLCCDVDDDTLILRIDEDEAFDILFGDLKNKLLKSLKEHEDEKCKQENT